MTEESELIPSTDTKRLKSAPKSRTGPRKKRKRKSSQNGKRGRAASKPFPGTTFESVLPLAKVIFDHAGASREMRRLTVFDKLGKGPESGPSRMLIINSARYGLTTGGVQAEVLKLTEEGVLVLDPSTSPAKSTQAKFDLAIKNIAPFNALYEKFKNGKLPAPEVMKDALNEFKLDEDGRPKSVWISLSATQSMLVCYEYSQGLR